LLFFFLKSISLNKFKTTPHWSSKEEGPLSKAPNATLYHVYLKNGTAGQPSDGIRRKVLLFTKTDGTPIVIPLNEFKDGYTYRIFINASKPSTSGTIPSGGTIPSSGADSVNFGTSITDTYIIQPVISY